MYTYFFPISLLFISTSCPSIRLTNHLFKKRGNANNSALRRALRYRQRRNLTYKQMCERLYDDEVRKPEQELNGVALQFLDQLKNNASLTPGELREFLVPAPNIDSEVIIYGQIDWRQRRVSLLK